MWSFTVGEGSIRQAPWPAFDESILRADRLEIVVQVNGRLRGKILADRDCSEEDARKLALGTSR